MRVIQEFFPMSWNNLSAHQRLSLAHQRDDENNPELEEVRRIAWEESMVGWDYWKKVPLLTAQEFCILHHVRDPRDFERDRASIPDGIGKSLGERVSDELKIIARSLGPETMKTVNEWVIWARQQEVWSVPSYLRVYSVEDDVRSTSASPIQPVSAWQVWQNFTVIADADKNEAWWKKKMSDAKRYGLLKCRVGEGKKGRSGGSLWRPDMIAGWLVDRHEKGNEGLSADAVHKALKRFPDCKDIADTMSPQDE